MRNIVQKSYKLVFELYQRSYVFFFFFFFFFLAKINREAELILFDSWRDGDCRRFSCKFNLMDLKGFLKS